ncbi:hypothetical protein ACE14D_22200, partial [Streptomyces sp. Act-28]
MPQQQSGRQQPSEVSMRDLLASCAAANAVSTPPRPAPPGEPDRTDGGPADAAADADRSEEHEAPRAACCLLYTTPSPPDDEHHSGWRLR